MKKAGYVFLLVLLICHSTTNAQYYINAVNRPDTCGTFGDGGPVALAGFQAPTGICRDGIGNLYVGGDYIRLISAATGIITTIAGGGPITATGDNIPATNAYIYHAAGLCIDTAGDLLIADGTSRIRKVTIATGIITTVAGTLTAGYSGDGGPATAADLYGPGDVKVDTANNIYIADGGNGFIRKVDAVTGIISTIAGIGGFVFGGDGGLAKEAELKNPISLFIDKQTNIYIADAGNERIRKITAATGIITTIAGTGVAGFSGDGGPATTATFSTPFDVTLDDTGNVYIGDLHNYRIRKINASTGIVNTIAGNGKLLGGGVDSVGNGGPAMSAPVWPWYLCLDTCGNIFLTDDVCALRVLTPTSASYKEDCKSESSGSLAIGNSPVVQHITVYPNPATEELNITGVPQSMSYRICNVTGISVQQGTLQAGSNTLSVLHFIPGIYILEMTGEDGVRNMVRVVKE